MKTPTILIVEDEGIIARDIRQQLGELGYEVVGDTPTGEEALVLVGRLKPDLVLMDIHLAGKMDGIEAAQTIRKQHRTPVVFLTAFAGAETLERAKVTEPFGYIIKPFDERALHTVIEMALYKHRAESDLRRAYDEQAIILRTAHDAFFMADWQGRLLDVNESATVMLGYTRDELLKMSLAELDSQPNKSRIAGLESMKQPETARLERTYRCKDGHTISVELSVNYLPHAGGRIFCFARDITERKAAEEGLVRLNEELEVRVALRTQDLEEAKQVAERATGAKASFLATMTHELRTPLNGVIGTVDVLRKTTLETHQTEMLDLVSESALSLLTIVDDILDFSKMEAGRLAIESLPFSVRGVVEKVCSVLGPMADKTGVELTLFTDPKLPPLVMGDGARLKQILLNLANNAVKFSTQKDREGNVSLRATLVQESAETVAVLFEVKDDGIGMDAATRGALFRSFTQGDPSISRRFGGTGLGLAISHNLVQLMGGEITVTSELGKGSMFRVRLPFPLPQDRAKVEPVSTALDGVSCLVIGDRKGFHGDLAAYLEASGAAVDLVDNLALAAKHSAAHPKGLWVWILDLLEDVPTLEALRAAARPRPEAGTGFVLIGRGRRRRARPITNGVFVVDANLLRRDTFLNAVACASGRVDLETFTTPITIKRAPKAPPSREEAKKASRLVLVAEDNEVNRKVILRQLSLLGYAADVAEGGLEALERWRSGDYSLLFADLHMPDMDGFQLTAAIRAQEPITQHIVIVALTADVLEGGAQKCRDAGLDDYLCKPARLSEIKAMLEKWLPLDRLTRGVPRFRVDGGAAPSLPPSDAAQAPPVDIGVLEDLVGRDPDIIREFLRAFLISTAKTASELKVACTNRQTALVADLAHKLKAPARSVGALRLAELCDEMHRAATGSDFQALQNCLPLFEAERANVEDYLRQS